jgi:hypothetical protein
MVAGGRTLRPVAASSRLQPMWVFDGHPVGRFSAGTDGQDARRLSRM